MTSRDPHSRRFWPSPATCLALLALFVALGGTTYAVTALPPNSVGGAQLRDRSVTEDELANRSVISRKLATGAVTNRKIARGTVTGSRFAPDALGGDQIDESLLGTVPRAAEAERATLALRAQTADLVERAAEADHAEKAELADKASVADSLAVVDRVVVSAPVPEGARDVFVIPCGAGQAVTGGGWLQADDFGDIVYLSSSAPSAPDRWLVVAVDDPFIDTGQDTNGFAYAVCVKAGSS